jgi:hypothetical protein
LDANLSAENVGNVINNSVFQIHYFYIPMKNPLKSELDRRSMSVKDLYFLLNREISKSSLYSISSGIWVLQEPTARVLEEYLDLPQGRFAEMYEAYQQELVREMESKYIG